METVNWDDVDAFCTALGEKVRGRVELPSEAQWEYACRAGTTTPYHFGSKLDAEKANTDPGRRPVENVDVGGYRPNGFGLHDMHGNVKEWVADHYGPYDKLAGTTDPIPRARQPGDLRILRGGSWYDNGSECRAADRVFAEVGPNLRAYDIGFRVCVRLD